MKNFKKFVFVLLALLLIAVAFFMSKVNKPNDTKSKISVTTFALYDVTKHIVGKSMDVDMIIPIGVDAHSFEPTPKTMININRSNLVIYSGAGLEPWVRGFKFHGDVINMSKYVKLRMIKHSEHKDSNLIDPHYWLDPNNMMIAAKVITKELIKLFPKKQSLYIKNRDKYLNMLSKLDEDYKKSLSSCKRDTIIVNHNAFGYMAKRYGFKVDALSGLTPEAEPSAKNMSKLIDMIKKHSISTVFFESFVNNRAMKSIADETKSSVEVLQPLANITSDEQKKHSSYESIMRENLNKLSKALLCR